MPFHRRVSLLLTTRSEVFPTDMANEPENDGSEPDSLAMRMARQVKANNLAEQNRESAQQG